MQDRQSRYPDMAIVCIEHGMMRAEVIKAKLEDAGIPVWLDYESLGRVYGITFDGLGEVRILTPIQYADEARALIEEQPEEPPEEQWTPDADSE